MTVVNPTCTFVSGKTNTLTQSTALASAIAIGTVFQVGDLILISHYNFNVGDVGEFAYDGGIYDVIQDPAQGFNQGDRVYVDFATGYAVPVPTATTMFFGICVSVGGSAAGSATVRATHSQFQMPRKKAVAQSVAAAGTTAGTAAALASGCDVYPTTGANGAAGVIVNALDQVTSKVLYIGNGVSNQTLLVYPPTGGTINGAAANAALVTASGRGVVLMCLNGTANTWLAF